MNAFLLDGAYDTDRNTFAIAVYPPMDSVRGVPHPVLARAGRVSAGGRRRHRCGHQVGDQGLPRQRLRIFPTTKPATPAIISMTRRLPRPIFRQNEFGASLGGPGPLRRTRSSTGSTKGCGKSRGTPRWPSCRTRPREAAISPAETHLRSARRRTGYRGPRAVSRQPHSASRIDPIAATF